MPAGRLPRSVAIVVKLGVLRNRHEVKTDDGVFGVRPSEAGGYVVEAPPGQDPGVVRYDEKERVLDIQRPGLSLRIRFGTEQERTFFDFDEHHYEVGTLDFGKVDVAEAGRQVVGGYATVSGVRLEFVAPDIRPIERELAFGLALRSAWTGDTIS